MRAIFDMFVRNPVYSLLGALAVIVVAMMTFSVVPETHQALVLRYGQIERVVNPYRANQRFGRTGAGLMARVPFLEQVQLIDKRVRSVTLDGQPVLSTDQTRVQVDAYARYRVTDAARMYSSIGTVPRLEEQLTTLLSSRLRNELGRRTFAQLLSPERDAVMTNIRRSLSADARRYGAEIVDVRINRAELPNESRDSAFERMRSARIQAATEIDAEGRRQARVITGNADAEAARIYAESFGRDPEFYAFYRAMRSYETTFASEGAGATTFVLPSDEGYMSQFGGRGRGQ
jgi:modulator of FtsH protease HflC